MLVFLGVGADDDQQDLEFICRKLIGLRIFGDEQGKMNRSILEVGGAMLLVSQFTLYGDCRKGRRPSFQKAATPDRARALFEQACLRLATLGARVETGQFQAHMEVSLCNDGPVTLILDSHQT